MSIKKNNQGSMHVVLIVIVILAIIGALGFYFWQSVQKDIATLNNKSSSSKTSGDKTNNTADTATGTADEIATSQNLTEADKAAATTFATKFYTDYETIVKDDAKNQADTSKAYSYDASINALIAKNATDNFILHYFKNHLTETLKIADPIMCAQAIDSKSPYATNATISGNYIKMDIMYFDKVNISVDIVKESDFYKINSATCQ